MSYECLPVIFLLFPPSFNSILQKGRGLSESSSDKSRANWGQLMAAHTAVLALATDTELPARGCRHEGWAGLVMEQSWEERHKSIGNESSLAWLPVGQLITDFIQCFSSQFLGSTENYFSRQ